MDNKIINTIAATVGWHVEDGLTNYDTERNECRCMGQRPAQSYDEHLAESILAALRADPRIAITELPEPTRQAVGAAGVWRVLVDGEPEDLYYSTWHRDIKLSGRLSVDADEARALAAALWAAANAAELVCGHVWKEEK